MHKEAAPSKQKIYYSLVVALLGIMLREGSNSIPVVLPEAPRPSATETPETTWGCESTPFEVLTPIHVYNSQGTEVDIENQATLIVQVEPIKLIGVTQTKLAHLEGE